MPAHFDVTVTDTATRLDDSIAVDGAPTLAREVLLEADTGNTGNILWGSSALQNMRIEPGERQIVPVNQLGEIFVSVASGTESLHVAWVK